MEKTRDPKYKVSSTLHRLWVFAFVSIEKICREIRISFYQNIVFAFLFTGVFGISIRDASGHPDQAATWSFGLESFKAISNETGITPPNCTTSDGWCWLSGNMKQRI